MKKTFFVLHNLLLSVKFIYFLTDIFINTAYFNSHLYLIIF